MLLSRVCRGALVHFAFTPSSSGEKEALRFLSSSRRHSSCSCTGSAFPLVVAVVRMCQLPCSIGICAQAGAAHHAAIGATTTHCHWFMSWFLPVSDCAPK